jgi:hypothetical protein
MLKLILTGIWICAVTLGAVYYSVQSALPPEPGSEEAASSASLEYIRGENLSIPVIADGEVSGYFVARITVRIDRAKVGKVEIPLKQLLTDEMITLLSNTSMTNLAHVRTFDPEAFKNHVKTGLNGKLGEGVVDTVLIEQLDYLSKADIRAKNGEGPESIKIVEGESVPTDKAH